MEASQLSPLACNAIELKADVYREPPFVAVRNGRALDDKTDARIVMCEAIERPGQGRSNSLQICPATSKL